MIYFHTIVVTGEPTASTVRGSTNYSAAWHRVTERERKREREGERGKAREREEG